MSAAATHDRALAAGRAQLRAAGVDTAALDARLLMEAAGGLDRLGLIMAGGDTVPEATAARYAAFLQRRAAGEPVGRIVGFREFYGRRFALGPATLEPRPDTETLVEAVLERVRAGRLAGVAADGTGLSFIDVGTGSGILAVTLAAELPGARGIASDLAPEALALARGNAAAHGAGDRLAFVAGSYLAPFSGRFALIVSNPPYIASKDIASLAREVRLHDPRLALDGGADGLDAYRALMADGRALLTDGGLLSVEIGADQGESVPALMAVAGFADVEVVCDLAGRARVIVGINYSQNP